MFRQQIVKGAADGRRASVPPARPTPRPRSAASRAVAPWARALPIQFSLKVSRRGDPYEQEAERLAAQAVHSAGPQVQRKTCACGRPVGPEGMCDACRRQKQLQRKSAGEQSQSSAPPAVEQVLARPGRPLDPATRAFMESRLGHDFGSVRVHTDSRAAASAEAVQAKAYTVGQNIVFGAGQYPPGTASGRRLLAHELVHTLQQESGLLRQVQREEEENSSGSIVYICSKELDTSPIGSHAFFRIGGSSAGNPTISLQPIDARPGSDCWQGVPDRNYPSDYQAEGACEPTPISEECLEREFRAYPVGHYCTWGPNSNTFVGHVARNCGVADPDPAGATPGIGDSPPPGGTFAPSKWRTLLSCTTKACE
ncbi:MAG: DUF4157 domain-containing protein [Candidatus Promineifilaceae bacterium]|nr:DUF4157 domain-containing protein [Candidatus Promineifilaceae bacterium]